MTPTVSVLEIARCGICGEPLPAYRTKPFKYHPGDCAKAAGHKRKREAYWRDIEASRVKKRNWQKKVGR